METARITEPLSTQKAPTVPSYQDEVWESTWKRRSAGLWAGVLTGAMVGSVIGALACLSTVMVGVSVASAVALMPIVLPAVMIAGIGMGMTVFTAVGAPAGAVAHGLKVQDERNRECDNASGALGQKKEKLKRNWDWRVAIPAFITAAAVGALFASTGGLGAVAAISGSAITDIVGTGLAAKTTTCLIVSSFGLYGTLFSFNMPKFSYKSPILWARSCQDGSSTKDWQMRLISPLNQPQHHSA